MAATHRQPNTRQSAPSAETPFLRRRIVVIAVGFMAMLVAIAVVWFAMRALPELPVKEVRFVGQLTRVDADELARVASAVAKTRRSALRTDLDEVKAAVMDVAWVRKAEVRRQLPGTLVVKIEEHIPYGVWIDVAGSTGAAPVPQLVNNFGEVFKARLSAATSDGNAVEMPVFAGPPGSGKDVLLQFDQFRKQLAPLGRMPKELRLSNRRAWTVRLDNGSVLELGRADAETRLSRYIRAYRELAELQAANAHVDLRYQTGLSLRTPPGAGKSERSKRS
jgi:cell division protein FtsQ